MQAQPAPWESEVSRIAGRWSRSVLAIPDSLPFGTALVLGLMHAIDLDHVMAASTYVSGRPAVAAAVGYGIRWGLGHSVAVLIAGLLVLAFGITIDPRFERLAEGAVGVMLIALGGFALKALRNLHLHGPPSHGDHVHLHTHRAADPKRHDHPHEPKASEAHHHPRRPLLVGLMHGIAGGSGAIAILPVTLISDWRVGIAYLVIFCLGVTVGMVLFAFGLAAAVRHATGRSLRWGRAIGLAFALASIATGLFWISGATAGG